MKEVIKIDKNFDTEHLRTDLKKHSLKSGAHTLTAQVASLFIRLISSIALARLLVPDDFGLVAMTSSFIALATVFQDLGLSAATIQKKDLAHEQVNSLFWINTLVGIILSILVISTSSALADFYKEPKIRGIAYILSLSFFFSGLSAQHIALLKRQMKFKKIALIKISSSSFSTATAIVMAILGFGYWSLAWMGVIASLTTAVGAWIACRWRPQRFVRFQNIKSMLRFGGHITFARIFTVLSRKIDNILIGRFVNPMALGLYSKSYQLVLMPISNIRGPIVSVALPAMCSLQKDHDLFVKYFQKIVFIIAFISMPMIALLFASSGVAIPLILGDNWIGMVPIFQALAAAAFIQPALGVIGIVFIALGRTRQQLIANVLNGCLDITSIIVGLQWGVIGVAAAYSISTYLGMVPVLIYCFHSTPLSLSDFFYSILKPALFSIFSGFVVYILLGMLTMISVSLALPFALVIGLSTYLLCWLSHYSGRQTIKEVSVYLKFVMQKNRKTN